VNAIQLKFNSLALNELRMKRRETEAAVRVRVMPHIVHSTFFMPQSDSSLRLLYNSHLCMVRRVVAHYDAVFAANICDALQQKLIYAPFELLSPRHGAEAKPNGAKGQGTGVNASGEQRDKTERGWQGGRSSLSFSVECRHNIHLMKSNANKTCNKTNFICNRHIFHFHFPTP